MYFALQSIAGAVRDAARLHAAPPALTGGEEGLKRARAHFHAQVLQSLRGIPADRVPGALRDALVSGEAVGPDAARWLPAAVDWLARACQE
ncbi:MAG: hypothetical protein BGP24_20070 [Lysobacterales bacterium 69-70]|nr:hypothetical protein [Xanthomonadaceae bacterium]ODU35782.1 MAG: hypothetical protein ABS97_02860 [Xanthomonadaceae bacterium SCN 69-320]ODV17480.1 MAG: hypothetical protein ABT27_17215 [Xanthomonadaceae bacterium SCN 69-25]OJY97270.1 MAG: hypothetical protein BGP24_20070 [Xanthomonadales bacterium 69-70]